MKIPSRQVVNSQISENRRQQVLEGVQIAKKVDVLRGSLSQLEKTQNDFIAQSTKELTEATSLLYQKKQDLEKENKELEIKREKLREPLYLEWQNLEEEKLRISIKNKDNEIVEVKLKDREFSLSEKEKEIKNNFKKSELILSEAERKEKETNDKLIESQNILKNAQNQAENFKNDINEREKVILLKEEKIQFDLQANENVKTGLKLKEEELKDREITLKDREEVLKRNINRLNKK